MKWFDDTVGCEQVVEFLIRNGADVNTKCDEEWTSLHWTAYNGIGYRSLFCKKWKKRKEKITKNLKSKF